LRVRIEGALAPRTVQLAKEHRQGGLWPAFDNDHVLAVALPKDGGTWFVSPMSAARRSFGLARHQDAR
jgi:hypothetical protein